MLVSGLSEEKDELSTLSVKATIGSLGRVISPLFIPSTLAAIWYMALALVLQKEAAPADKDEDSTKP